ncbi:MAG: hypothetical protein IT379_02880 [Deltaproteobacteria bacterium]|nr:hypothetical protein [Deltaproteobacteria bacterium]
MPGRTCFARMGFGTALALALFAGCGDDDGAEPTDSGPAGDAGRIDLGPTPPPMPPPTPPTPPTPPPPPPPDASAEGGPGDAGPDAAPDASADSGPDGGPDADTDAGPPRTCDVVTEDLRFSREDAAYCETSYECASRLSPTCPEGACHVYFTTGYFLDEMMSYEDEYNALDCGEGTACRCPPPPDTFSCNDGVCGACPATRSLCPYTCAIDCECFVDACGCDQPFCVTETCEQLQARIQAAVYDMSGCTADEECVVGSSPLCPEVGCYLAHHVGASPAQLNALVRAYQSQGCGGAVCACTPPPERAICNGGTCEGAP